MKIRYMVVIVIALLCTAANAQDKTFLRLYSVAGNKFSKGYFYATTDSSVLIYKKGIKEVLSADIGYIKTRRSFGHHVLVGALIGAIPASIIGAALNHGSPDNWFYISSAEAAAGGFIAGGTVGAATGAIVSGSTKRFTFRISGNLEAWHTQRKLIDLYPTAR